MVLQDISISYSSMTFLCKNVELGRIMWWMPGRPLPFYSGGGDSLFCGGSSQIA